MAQLLLINQKGKLLFLIIGGLCFCCPPGRKWIFNTPISLFYLCFYSGCLSTVGWSLLTGNWGWGVVNSYRAEQSSWLSAWNHGLDLTDSGLCPGLTSYWGQLRALITTSWSSGHCFWEDPLFSSLSRVSVPSPGSGQSLLWTSHPQWSRHLHVSRQLSLSW